MSELQRSFAKAKLASLPAEAPLVEEPAATGDQTNNSNSLTAQDQIPSDDYDSSSASSISSTGTVVPTATHPSSAAPPIAWPQYFAQELYLSRADPPAQFHVYLTPPATPSAPLVVAHHGAGSSGMTFALFAEQLRRLLPEAGILAVEARAHGSVAWDEDGAEDGDFSLALLSQDLEDMVRLTAEKVGWKELPNIVLVGHSLGGAVVTETARRFAFGPKLVGYAVLDVVEGSAMEALRLMQAYIANRPSLFDSVDKAVEWHVRSRTLRNPESARASVPSLLMQTKSGRWAWKTDLTMTEPYWENWFTGMSGKFLGSRGAKLLILAGTDRLDKELMIGQMQGKFQLQVFPAAGHFLQEDQPEKTAEVVVEFIKRNDRSTLVLPPKVSDLLAQGKKV